MKAKKVYEFINPKTDEYELEDTLPLGPKAIILKKIDDWFKTWAPDAEYTIDDDLNIIVEHYLDLSNKDLTELPGNLKIKGWLDLQNTKLTILPDNLYIDEDLDITDTQITELPKNLTVDKNIWLMRNKVKFIPDSVSVWGNYNWQ